MTLPHTAAALPEPPFTLTGDGLFLREWTQEDIVVMVRLFDEPEVARWTPLSSPFDLDAAQRYLDRAGAAREAGTRIQFAVGEVAGTGGGSAPRGEALAMLKGEDRRDVELGYAIGAAHRGRGLAVRSVRLLTDFAWTTLGARRVVLRIEPDNDASSAVARRAGFTPADLPFEIIEDPDGTRIALRIWEHRRPLVQSVSLSPVHGFSKDAVASVELLEGLGVRGDTHLGVTVQHRSRVAQDPTQPNLRQVHLIHAELHEELLEAGFEVAAGELGENITTRGIDLLGLPRGARLHLGAEAVVEVTGLRNPCDQINGFQPGLLKQVLGRDGRGALVRKAGIMAVVLRGGEVRPGDPIRVELPAGPHQALDRV
jgi:MOSC domain-containing protein YiiM/RimJ/RimL family protein N-acetyltransferase